MIINIAGGRGPMGQVHKKVFENQGHKVIISGRNTTPSLEQAAEQADLTIISVPIPVTVEIIKKVAPYSSALMDFTGVKVFPIKTMLDYSSLKCEVAGLHPMYGNVSSIKNRPIIYCPTERTREKCIEVVTSLKNEGANIINMRPKDHDFYIDSIQNKRVEALTDYFLELKKTGLSIEKIYEISPRPTQIMLDLLARQCAEENDELYSAMKEYNPYSRDRKKENNISPQEVRNFFGAELKAAQERVKRLIELN